MRSPSDQTPALTGQQPPAADSDYDSIHAAVMETVRGRWFLAEYARRNRHAETDALLTAIGRIESFVQEQVQERVQDEAQVQDHEPDAAPSENNDNWPASSGDVTAAEPLVVPQDRLAAANAALLLVRDRIRDVADSLIECGAPSFLTNDLKRGVDDLSRICAQRAEMSGAVQAIDADAPAAASLQEAAMQEASLQERSMQDVAVQESVQDDASDVADIAEPQPRRDPFADIRALSDIEKIALFT